MAKFVFLVNEDGYKKYTFKAAKDAGCSVPNIGSGVKYKLFRLHNAEPLNRAFELPFKHMWFKSVVDEQKLVNKGEDIIFLLYESFHMSYSRRLIKHFRNKYDRSRFYYMFTNPANDYNLKRLETISDLLDGIITFNAEDADKYGFLFFNEELFELPKQKDDEPDTDVFFVGADKGRLKTILSVYEKLSKDGLVCDFWITDVPKNQQKYSDRIHYNQTLTYEEVLRHDAKSRCILEVLQDGKQYSSIRTLEAIQYHKKLITMSEAVKVQWFYDPRYILVFKQVEDITSDFIRNEDTKGLFQVDILGSFNHFKDSFMRVIQNDVDTHTHTHLPTLRDLYRQGLSSVILSDLARICKPTIKNALKTYLFPRGTVFRFDVWLRILQWARTTQMKKIMISPIAYLIMRHYEFKYGIHANANIYIGRGLHIKHGDGVHLNCSFIGENFTVYQGVTIGAKHGEVPIIMDNVTVYTNSVVCGGITLFDRAIVGAQSYVDKDVDSSQYVAGVPAQIISQKKYNSEVIDTMK